jgi:hypothetical protein
MICLDHTSPNLAYDMSSMARSVVTTTLSIATTLVEIMKTILKENYFKCKDVKD